MTAKDLRTVRKLIGLNVEQLAFLVGCSPSYISMIETGARRLTPSMQRKIVDGLGVKMELLKMLIEVNELCKEAAK